MQHELFIFLILFLIGTLALDYCGPNTMRTKCGNPCQETCGQLKPRRCSKICQPDTCVCKPNYIRRDENGPCIPNQWCKWVAEKWKWQNLREEDDSS